MALRFVDLHVHPDLPWVGAAWRRKIQGFRRSLQPIHFLDTAWGGSSREGFLPAGKGGLTALGRAMLAKMAERGMLLDLAHMNARTARECLSAYPGSPGPSSRAGVS